MVLKADLMKIIACILLTLAIGLSGCTFGKKKPDKKTPGKRAKPELRAEESSDVDFQAFVGRLRKAVESHDVDTLASMMTPDFAYVLGSSPGEDRKGDGVFKYWDEQGLWPELEGILTEKFVKKGDFMVAPPQFADESLNYDGYRAGIRRIKGSWKFCYFVNG